MAYSTPATQTTGALITSSVWNTDIVDNIIYLKSLTDQVGGLFTVAKTADETVNNSTTFQSDDHLLFSLAASQRALVQVYALVTQNSSAADIKFQWSVPASCVYYIGGTGDSAGLGTQTWSISSSGATPVVLSTTTLAVGTANDATNPIGIYFSTLFKNSTNAGNCTLQWAQNSAVATDLKLLSASVIEVRKYA